MSFSDYTDARDKGVQAMMRGDLKLATRLLEHARELAGACAASYPGIVDMAEVNLAMIRVQNHEDDLAEKGLREVLLRSTNDDVIRLAAHCLAKVLSHAGAHEKALRFAKLSLEKARGIGDPLRLHSALQLMGAVLANQSYLDDAVQYYEEALEVLERDPPSNPADEAFYWTAATDWLGYVLVLTGRVAEGRGRLEAAHERAKAFGIVDVVAETGSDLCFAYLQEGRLADARKVGDEALAIAESEGLSFNRRNCYYLLGEVASRMGEDEVAERYYRKLGELYPQVPFIGEFLREYDVSALINLKEFA